MDKQTAVNKNQKPNVSKKVRSSSMYNIILAIILSVTLVIAVLGGVFYFVIKYNVNALSDKYLKVLQNVPIVKNIIPKAKEEVDPTKLSQKELIEQFISLTTNKESLTKKNGELTLQNSELQKYKVNLDKVLAEKDIDRKNIEIEKAKLGQSKIQLEADKKKLDQLITSGDKSGFKDYFEKVDKLNAQKIYADIIKEQKISEETKKLSQLYELMDASKVAKIFEELGSSKIDLVLDILKNMKKENQAEVLSAMTSSFSSSITEKMAKSIK